MPRVCYVTESFFPPDVGGLQRHAYRLAEMLIASGVPVFVITRQIDPATARSERFGNVAITRIPPHGQLKGRGWRALAPLALFVTRILGLLLRNAPRYDIVLVSGIKVLPIPAVLACKAAGKRCAVRLESPIELWEEISADSLKKMRRGGASALLKVLNSLRRKVVTRADRFIAISAEMEQELVKSGIEPRKIRRIPYGIDTNRFRPATPEEKHGLRRRLGLPAAPTIFVFTGRLAISKGVLVLADAWRELRRRHEEVHLVIVGSPMGAHDPCETELRDFIGANALASSVTLTGEVENVHEYLQAADVFVFPSEYEGFGMSIAEALACGLPAVLTRVGVANEHIRDRENGLLVDFRDRRQLEEAMEWLLQNGEARARIGESARAGVQVKYSMEAVTANYVELFTELGSEIPP